MSIYLAGKAQNNATHPLFTQRDIKGYAPAPLNAVNVIAFPILKEVAYDGYTRNVDMFIAATSRNRRIMCHETDGSLVETRPIITIGSPNVAFLPKGKVTPEITNALVAKFSAMSPTVKKSGKTDIIILASPTPAMASKLLAGSAPYMLPTTNSITPRVYKTYVTLCRIMSEFLATNTYPAFPTLNSPGEYNGDMNFIANTLLVMGEGKKKRADMPPLFMEIEKKRKLADKAVPGRVAAQPESDVTLYSYDGLDSRAMVVVAKPSPTPASANVVGPSELPFFPGLLFPYFDRMNISEPYTIRHIISEYFLRNLGATREEQAKEFSEISSDLGQLSKTKEGGYLAHIYKGIEMALKTQTRLVIVRSSAETYEGFALLGQHFEVHVNGVKYAPESAESLASLASSMTSHGAALEAICLALSAVKTTGGKYPGTVQEVKPSEITYGADLWDLVAEREESSELDAALKKYTGLVSFSRSYAEPSAPAFLTAIMRVVEGAVPKRETPVALPISHQMATNIETRNLAVFGPTAPSVWNTQGASYAIPKEASSDPNNAEKEKGGKFLPLILMTIKPLFLAGSDLNRVLVEGRICLNLKERAGKNRNIVVAGAARDALYEGLRNAIHSEANEKRHGGNEPAKKKAKKGKEKAVESEFDVLALFEDTEMGGPSA